MDKVNEAWAADRPTSYRCWSSRSRSSRSAFQGLLYLDNTSQHRCWRWKSIELSESKRKCSQRLSIAERWRWIRSARPRTDDLNILHWNFCKTRMFFLLESFGFLTWFGIVPRSVICIMLEFLLDWCQNFLWGVGEWSCAFLFSSSFVTDSNTWGRQR